MQSLQVCRRDSCWLLRRERARGFSLKSFALMRPWRMGTWMGMATGMGWGRAGHPYARAHTPAAAPEKSLTHLHSVVP